MRRKKEELQLKCRRAPAYRGQEGARRASSPRAGKGGEGPRYRRGVGDRKEGERNYIQGVEGNEREKCQECEPGSWAGSAEPRPGSAEPAGVGRNGPLESRGQNPGAVS